MSWLDGITQWTWVCVSSGSWWQTGKPSVHEVSNRQTRLNDWAELNRDLFILKIVWIKFKFASIIVMIYIWIVYKSYLILTELLYMFLYKSFCGSMLSYLLSYTAVIVLHDYWYIVAFIFIGFKIFFNFSVISSFLSFIGYLKYLEILTLIFYFIYILSQYMFSKFQFFLFFF